MDSVQSNYDIVFFGVSDTSHPTYRIIGLDYDQITSISNLNDTFYMSVTFNGTCYFRSCMGNGPWYDPTWTSTTYSNTTLVINTGAQQNGLYLMYNNDIPNVADGPYQNWNLLSFSPPYIFDLDIKTNNDTQYFSITTEFNNTISDIPLIYQNDFGIFYDNTYEVITHDDFGFWYYNGTSWVYKLLFNRSDKEFVLIPGNDYLSVAYNTDNPEIITYFTLNDLYSFKNVVFEYTINNSLYSTREFFLIGTDNTTVNNGVIDTSSFGSNYLNQFEDLNQIINDNNNTQQIIDNVNDDSEVDNILESISSGDSIDSLAHNLGIVTIENPFTDIVFGIFNGAIDSLTYSGDVSLNFGFHGQDIYIKSSDFATPTNTITTFIGFIMDALFVYALYWYYFMIIESIKNFTFYQDIVNNSKWNITSSSNGDLSWRLL